MTIEKYIKDNAYKLGRRINIAPNIPYKKIEQITNSFAEEIPDTYIIIAGDATLTGSGATGFAFSGFSLFYANSKNQKMRVDFEEIESAEFIPCGKRRQDNFYELDDVVKIICKTGREYNVESCLVGFDCNEFANIINGIVSLIHDGVKPVCTKQIVSVSDLSDYTKIAYVKTLCNYAYMSNNYIDPDSYSAIQNIIVRMELSAESRNELRDYMKNIESKIKTGYLIKMITDSTDFGSFEVLRFALVQDVLYIHNIIKPNDAWQNDGFIGSLINTLKIHPSQLETIIKSCNLNYKVSHSDNNLATLQSEYESLQKEAVQKQIPLLSLYCAGSAYSIDTYWSVFGGRNKKQVSIDKQRELMLQEIIKNNQKAVNNLVEEMNEVSSQLINEIEKGAVADEKIKRLASMLGRLQAGALHTVGRVDKMENASLVNNLPRTLDDNILRKLKSPANNESINFIRDFYELRSTTYELRDNLSKEDMVRLHRSLTDIGYPINEG